MSKRLVVPVLLVAILLLGGWSLAQQAEPAKKIGDAGRFMVSPAGKSAVLLETTTGKTWVLTESSVDGSPVWLPALRLNSDRDVSEWRHRETMFEEVKRREREEFERLKAKLQRERILREEREAIERVKPRTQPVPK